MLAVLDCMIGAGGNLLPRLFSCAVRSCTSPAGLGRRQLSSRFGDLGTRRARGRRRGRQGAGASTDGATSAARILQEETARTPERRRRGARASAVPCGHDPSCPEIGAAYLEREFQSGSAVHTLLQLALKNATCVSGSV